MNSSSKGFIIPCTALKQNLGDYKFKNAGEREAFLTTFLITQDTDFYFQQRIEKFMDHVMNALVVAGAMWKSSAIAAQLNLYSLYYS